MSPRGEGQPEPAGPVWTRSRLAFVLLLTFGANTRGRADTLAAADALGVSQRTVQRWLAGPAQEPAALPAARLERIRELARPEEDVLRQEDQAARYARDAIERIGLPKGRGVLPAWRDRRWLEPHLVVVLELGALGLRQVAVSRVSDRGLQQLRRRGEILDYTTVGTRFHATALVHALLQRLDPWRLQVPGGLVKQGRTQIWVADAPAVDLGQLAVTEGLR